MKSTFFVTLLLCLSVFVHAQGSKRAAKNNIESRTCWETDIEAGDKKFMESVKYFNENGDVSEEIVYDATKKVKSHVKYEYDGEGRESKEIKLDAKGNVKSSTTFEYEGKLLVKEISYDAKGNLKKTTVFKYENKLKIEKTEYNASGKPVNKKEFVYKKRPDTD